ncbi:MAG: helix-turn-helix domain-containing protein [Candidatus Saccharimonadales bacterium]
MTTSTQQLTPGATRTQESQTRLLTLQETADQLRISIGTLLRVANYGEIATLRTGRRRLIATKDLDTGEKLQFTLKEPFKAVIALSKTRKWYNILDEVRTKLINLSH